MSKKLTVAVVGATGAVGREMLKTLHERAFPATEIIPFASSRSAGTKVPFGDEKLTVRELKEDVFDGIDLALFSAGGSTYRGIKLDKATVKALRVGNKIDVNLGTASWSTAESTARSFSGSGYAGTGKRSVIFVSGTQTKGTSIKHISLFANENEVLVSKKAQYIIDSISIKPGSPYTYVYVKER